ncbi:MAG TPA: maleylpyruvate isomerase family mycothiol-dependent enzyme [Acidimicrobiales bacterium]|nr:maleylpyruvate isomerase family mycothiol-dependent enzyme [Acidimicrobiales bacterium]
MSDPQHNGAIGPPQPMIAACVASHARLVDHLEKVDDVVLRRPSRLQGWSIGHVLTHLARNADSFVRMLEAAEMGESVSQYPGGKDQRDGDIETGAARSAAACVNDVARSNARLEKAFSTASAAAWDGAGVWMSGQQAPCRRFPFRRWREVEFHMVDLGLGYEPESWPPEFVSLALSDTLAELPPRIADGAQRASLLAWLAGRRQTPGTIEFAPF